MLNEGLLFADRYKFVTLLGRGGFSEVWLAEDTLAMVQVAVKVYAPGTGLDENGIKLFTQEFSMVFDMNHTNLLRPTHFDCWDRMPYLIMPFIKNGSAFKYITEGKKMPEDECWKMLHDVAAGLAYLHEKIPPLIHQDIKPDNILINDEGHYLITDFGISARVRSTIRNGMAQEQSGGTMAYMGPERFSSNPRPIMASDIWSLGAMMYELMTGMPPFLNHGGVLQKNGADIPIIEEDYSDDLKKIVSWCLEKETWDRPSAKKIEEMTYNKMHGLPMTIEAKIPKKEDEKEELKTIVNEPIVQSEQQPVSQGGSPIPPSSGKLSETPTKGNNKKVLYGAIAGAVVLLVLLIAIFSGGDGDKASDEAAIEFVPAVNYDSLAQVSIKEGLSLVQQADTFLANHDDKYDEKYNKVENLYVNALKKFEEVLTNKDSIAPGISSNALQQKTVVLQNIAKIYNEFISTAKDLKDAGVNEAAIEFEKRANEIKPYIESLTDNNNTNSNE